MVNLVIASHTHPLAEAVKGLALQMAEDVRIETAGGVDEQTVGTNADRILDAINRAWSEDGVVVLTDLGSAVMSAEMAVEMLPEERRDRVRLTEGPLVEGTLAAGVEASGGADIETVARAVEQAGREPELERESVEDTVESTDHTKSQQMIVRNHHGLHARPAVMFSRKAGEFDARVRVRNVTRDTTLVDANRMMNVVKLGIEQDHTIEIQASGAAASKALEALRHLVEEELPELEPPQPDEKTETFAVEDGIEEPSPGVISGVGIFEGVAFGPVYHAGTVELEVETRSIDDLEKEWCRFQEAIAAVSKELERLQAHTERRGGTEEADIFEAMITILTDPGWQSDIREKIERETLNAEAAIQRSIQEESQELKQLGGSIFESRAADIEDLGNRLIARLQGRNNIDLKLPDHPVVLVARDLSPAQTVKLDPDRVQGFCTASGGPESHTAILARTLGIPTVLGAGDGILELKQDTQVALDGESGRVYVEPDLNTRSRLEEKQNRLSKRYREQRSRAQEPATTSDGHRVTTMANVSEVAMAQSLKESGAEGIGLLRTEFLFLGRDSAPGEDEQYEAYRTILETLGPDRPLVIRTLDIGGDKQVPYLDMEEEPNPYLGWRGIRVFLDRPELFVTQLRAILRVAAHGRVKVMFPMVAGWEELEQGREFVCKAEEQLSKENKKHAENIDVGIMVEVPSAALITDRLASSVEFFSIGTNDLTQYTRAASRENQRVAKYSDPFHPGVLQLIKTTVDHARNNGIKAALCGEMGGDPLAIPLLVGLGLEELSMVPSRIPRAKQLIRSFTSNQARTWARRALESQTAGQVRELMRDQGFGS